MQALLNLHTRLALAAFVAGCAAPAAQAAGYLELGLGRASLSADCTGTSSCDTSGSFVRAVGGYTFSDLWAGEVTVANLGKFSAAAALPGLGTVKVDGRTRSLGLGVAASFPINQSLGLRARFGVARNTVRLGSTVGGLAGRDSDSKTAPYFGASADWQLAGGTTLGFTIDRHTVQFADNKASVTTAGVGLRFSF